MLFRSQPCAPPPRRSSCRRLTPSHDPRSNPIPSTPTLLPAAPSLIVQAPTPTALFGGTLLGNIGEEALRATANFTLSVTLSGDEWSDAVGTDADVTGDLLNNLVATVPSPLTRTPTLIQTLTLTQTLILPYPNPNPNLNPDPNAHPHPGP